MKIRLPYLLLEIVIDADTSLMFVLDATTIMRRLPDGDHCSGHSTMIGAQVAEMVMLLSHEDLDDVMEPAC